MSNKPKIMVLQLKQIIYTALFLILGIALIVLLIFMFNPKNADSETSNDTQYVPGVYSTSVVVNSTPMDIQVSVDTNHINSIELVNTDDAITTMFPLIESSIKDIATQVVATQSLDNISYKEGSKYTYAILLDSIENALNKARVNEK